MRILNVTGQDVNGDGQPDAVFEDYDGGAHCCWTYWIVSLGDPPGLVRKIYNLRDATFTKSSGDGRVLIHTLDGAFDYFDDQSHAFTPFPSVYLRLEGHELKRVNEEYWPRYAAEIRNSKSKLSENDLRLFREKGPVTDELLKPLNMEESEAYLETEENILSIVLAYLYGGKNQEAWKTLHRYWPPKDERRMRELIKNTAEGGFLGDTSRPKYGIIE
jgi:hypothetical protein